MDVILSFYLPSFCYSEIQSRPLIDMCNLTGDSHVVFRSVYLTRWRQIRQHLSDVHQTIATTKGRLNIW